MTADDEIWSRNNITQCNLAITALLCTVRVTDHMWPDLQTTDLRELILDNTFAGHVHFYVMDRERYKEKVLDIFTLLSHYTSEYMINIFK